MPHTLPATPTEIPAPSPTIPFIDLDFGDFVRGRGITSPIARRDFQEGDLRHTAEGRVRYGRRLCPSSCEPRGGR